MKPYLILIAVCCLTLVSCKKEKQRVGITTTITGRIYDQDTKEPFRNIKLKVGEYTSRRVFPNPTQYTLVSYLDSTTTDDDGHYRLSFTTSGKGDSYHMEFKGLARQMFFYDVTDKRSMNYNYKEIEGLGQSKVSDFSILEYIDIKVHITVHDNPFPPLMMGVIINGTSFYAADYPIGGRNKDTTIGAWAKKVSGGCYLNF